MVALLPDGSIASFLLDTGATGKTLEAALFDRLVERQDVVAGLPSKAATVAGEIQAVTGRLSRLGVGIFEHEQLVVEREPSDTLGLDYLRRYQITFDFPRRAVYLHRGFRS